MSDEYEPGPPPFMPPYPIEYMPEGAVRFITPQRPWTIDDILYDTATEIDEDIMNSGVHHGTTED